MGGCCVQKIRIQFRSALHRGIFANLTPLFPGRYPRSGAVRQLKLLEAWDDLLNISQQEDR